MSSKRYDINIKAKAVEMYVSDYMPMHEIAKAIGCGQSTISKWIDKYFGKNENNFVGLKSKV